MTPFPPIERWRLPQAACELTREAVMPAGRHGCESGVFWLGRRAATSEIGAVVHPVGAAVEETPFYWRVAPEVYAAVAAWANPRELTLLAIAHIHLSAVRPGLSRTDRTQGLKVADALSVVVPRGGDEDDLEEWGWFIYEDGDYRAVDPAERRARVAIIDGEVEFARIDTGAIEAA
jgi:hypothetical protein